MIKFDSQFWLIFNMIEIVTPVDIDIPAFLFPFSFLHKDIQEFNIEMRNRVVFYWIISALNWLIKPSSTNVPHHIETTGFYMMGNIGC